MITTMVTLTVASFVYLPVVINGGVGKNGSTIAVSLFYTCCMHFTLRQYLFMFATESQHKGYFRSYLSLLGSGAVVRPDLLIAANVCLLTSLPYLFTSLFIYFSENRPILFPCQRS